MTSPDADHDEWLLKHVYTFDEHQEELLAIKKLDGIKNISDDLLRLRLGKIVYRYRGRYRDPQYYENMKSCIEDARAACDLARKLTDGLTKLDEAHLEVFQSCLIPIVNKIELASPKRPQVDKTKFAAFQSFVCQPMKTLYHDPGKWPLYFLAVSFLMASCAAALSIAMDRPLQQEQGRPMSQHFHATVELVDAWRDLTGKRVLSPKGQDTDKKGKLFSPQPSTQFIYLALKMIDPKVILSNAHSNIKLAMKFGDAEKKLMSFLASADLDLFTDTLKYFFEFDRAEREAKQKQKNQKS